MSGTLTCKNEVNAIKKGMKLTSNSTTYVVESICKQDRKAVRFVRMIAGV